VQASDGVGVQWHGEAVAEAVELFGITCNATCSSATVQLPSVQVALCAEQLAKTSTKSSQRFMTT